MDITAPEGLIEHFSKLDDPRVDRNKKHELIDVIVLCVCTVVSGAEGWSDIEEFGRTKLEWLRRYVPLANRVPVDDTWSHIDKRCVRTGGSRMSCIGDWTSRSGRTRVGFVAAMRHII